MPAQSPHGQERVTFGSHARSKLASMRNYGILMTIVAFSLGLWACGGDKVTTPSSVTEPSVIVLTGSVHPLDSRIGLDDAEVSIATGNLTVTAHTDGRGQFSVTLPAGTAPTLNVTKEGYVEASSALDPLTASASIDLPITPLVTRTP